MTNLEKYNQAFCVSLDVGADMLPGIKYQDIETWDSVGHMRLMAALEESFDIMMDIDDIIDFGSYEIGKEILTKNYSIEFPG